MQYSKSCLIFGDSTCRFLINMYLRKKTGIYNTSINFQLVIFSEKNASDRLNTSVCKRLVFSDETI